jgi:predicted DNA-binding antitoxin AbrB/MazE fold protein
MNITIEAIYDGEVLRPIAPLSLVPNQQYSITIIDQRVETSTHDDAWSILQSLTGTYDGPSDWSAEHDHYIYGNPKNG